MEVELDLFTRLIYKEAFLAVCNGKTGELKDLLPKLSNGLYISILTNRECRCGLKMELIALESSNFEQSTLHQMADNLERGTCDHSLDQDSEKQLITIHLLHFACYFGHIEIVKLLIKNGANVCCETSLYRYTPLQMAIYSKNAENIVVDIMSMLLDNGAIDSQRDDFGGQTFLHEAVNFSFASVVELLLKYNCDINAEDSDGKTALYLAVYNHRPDIIKILVSNKADVNKGPRNDLLNTAVRTCSADIVTLLLTHNADVNCADLKGNTPLLLSVSCENSEVLRELIKFGADVNHCNNYGYAAIHKAASYGKEGIVDILIEHGCDYDTRTIDGHTPLALACRGGFKSIALKLMNLEVNVNNPDSYLDTPLHYSSQEGCIETCKRLIELGADPSARSNNNVTPLWCAVYESSSTVIRLLLEINVAISVASYGIADRYGGPYDEPHTPLYVAFVYCKDPYIAAMLIIAGVNLSEEKWLRKRTDLMVFNKSPGSAPHVDLLRSYTESPVSLKRLCRDEIRRRLATRLADALPLLDLPASLIDYLLIKHDLELCEAGTLDLLSYTFN